MKTSPLIGVLCCIVFVSFAGSSTGKAEGLGILLSHPEALDGNTFKDDAGNAYRLHSVDAPELSQTCLDSRGESYACGRQSRDALAGMIDTLIRCRPVLESKDAEPSAVRCFDGTGRDIGARLVLEGWAVPSREHGLDYVMHEMEAEARSIGLWQGRFTLPAQWRAGVRL